MQNYLTSGNVSKCMSLTTDTIVMKRLTPPLTFFFLNFFFKFNFLLKLLYLSSRCAEALDCAKLSKSTGVADVPYVTL